MNRHFASPGDSLDKNSSESPTRISLSFMINHVQLLRRFFRVVSSSLGKKNWGDSHSRNRHN
jgi:hypothetical protein